MMVHVVIHATDTRAFFDGEETEFAQYTDREDAIQAAELGHDQVGGEWWIRPRDINTGYTYPADYFLGCGF